MVIVAKMVLMSNVVFKVKFFGGLSRYSGNNDFNLKTVFTVKYDNGPAT